MGINGPEIRQLRADVSHRRPEIELLRVVALVAVFAAHAAQPFNPWDVWQLQSPERSKWFGELVLFLAPWVMPMFVLLAGISAWYSLGTRSMATYLHERVTRLVIPLAVGILVVVPPQVYYGRRQHGLFDGSFAGFYPHFFEGVYPGGNFTWAHLWFLGVLGALALVTLPLFRWLSGATGRRVTRHVADVCRRPGGILLLAVPIIGLRVAMWAAFPHARPITTDWSNRTTLLAMFVYGYALAGEPDLIRAVDRQWKISLTVALAFSGAMFAWAWPGDFTQRFPVPFSNQFILAWSAYAIGGWAWCVALLGAARSTRWGGGRFFRRARNLLNPFYILHQTIIVVFAFYLIPLGASPLTTYLVLFVTAFVASAALALAACESSITRRLLGVRPRRIESATDYRSPHHDGISRHQQGIHA
jgi:glucans biosynthesis protein C